jgi:hypothetical protein
MQPGSSQKNLILPLVIVCMVSSVGVSGGKKRKHLSQRSNKIGIICTLSAFFDGAHLDNLGRICVEPVIMELLVLSSKVRRTDIIKVLLGFLPPYPLLTVKKNEEAKSKKTKHKSDSGQISIVIITHIGRHD